MKDEIKSAMGATRNVSMENLPHIMSAVRSWIARQPQVAHVEVLASKGMSPTARVTLKDGTHIVATAAEATAYPAGRQPWFPTLDAEFRIQRERASAAWRHYPGHGHSAAGRAG